ncbi:MAG TPA: glycosyltransferase family 39 protein [Terriglobales bacterium]|nr:glycosyltransferase family 39 protein [Terriglobales bacterium]
MSASASIGRIPETSSSLFREWSSVHSYLLLAAATLLCLLPFSGRAFHVDDPLFVWSAQQITKHPLDPYGFRLIWDNFQEPMSEVTKNPPLACYYAAVVGSIGGWSERALHLGFLLWPVALILGTYRLALRFTRLPLLAAAATLLTPGILVSATSVMCDTMMLALWTWAAILWVEGLEKQRQTYLLTSSVLLGLAALTKYFGISLLPLLVVYTLARKRRLGWWALYLLIPVGLLGGYQIWTAMKYGHGMFSQAMDWAQSARVVNGKVSPISSAAITLSFVGGCALSVLVLTPFLWGWKKLVAWLAFAALCSSALIAGWLGLGHYAEAVVRESLRAHWLSSGLQLTLAIAGGFAVLTLAGAELRNWQDSQSLFLGLSIVGTIVFTAFCNWTVNARSIVPLIPAAGILAARRLEKLHAEFAPGLKRKILLALILSGVVSFWLAKADTDWANSGRQAAEIIREHTQGETGTVWFQGHWGFQYYMQLIGAHPMDFLRTDLNRSDILVIPENNADAYNLPSPQFIASSELLQINLSQPLFTMRWRNGAGFYSCFYGPLPFAFGTPEPDRYYLIRLSTPMVRRLVPKSSLNTGKSSN